MSGLYNALFGYHPYGAVFLKALNVHPKDVPRFRDCFVDGEDLVIYTRTGGGNREAYEECEGPSNAKLRQIPGFVRDHDDSFDSTYAWFRYRIPDPEVHRLVLELAKTSGRPLPGDLHQNLLDDMQSGRNTQYTERAKQLCTELFKKMGIVNE